MMIFGNTTNTTYGFSFKQYNLFYTVQKHEIRPFMETVPYEFTKYLTLNKRLEKCFWNDYIVLASGMFF